MTTYDYLRIVECSGMFLIAAIIVWGFATFFIAIVKSSNRREDFEREAVARGHAQFAIDNDGNTEFRWNSSPPPTSH